MFKILKIDKVNLNFQHDYRTVSFLKQKNCVKRAKKTSWFYLRM